MNASPIIAIVLGVATLAAVVRYLRSGSRHRFVLAGLQPVAATLLYLALAVPPHTGAKQLTVVTGGATDAQLETLAALGPAVVALPEAGSAAAPAAPDLATALRARPETAALRVLGYGLGPRDLDAARGLPVTYERGHALRGIVALELEPQVVAGRALRVAGRVEGVAQARIELRDPSDSVVASAAPDAGGDFVLRARTRQPGVVRYRLRVFEAAGANVETLDLPVAVIESATLRIGVLGGAPGPELKYLRRHIVDAGSELLSRIGMSPGIELRDTPLALQASALAELDLLVADERGWAAASAAERSAIVTATRDGLGLLLRATGPLPAAVAAEWRELGVILTPDDEAGRARIAGRGPDALPALRLLPIRATAPGAVELSFEGSATGWWLPFGQGRVALWRAIDTHRLVTAGHAARHAELWATTFERLARARGAALPRVEMPARTGERAVLCGIAPDNRVSDPEGEDIRLVAIARGAQEMCAAYWPRRAGWHAVRAGAPAAEAAEETRAPRFFVHERQASPTLAAARAMRDTERLAARQSAVARASGAPRGARWPWWASWLGVICACWWLERRALAHRPAGRDRAAALAPEPSHRD